MDRRPASGTCRPVLPSEEELRREIERERAAIDERHALSDVDETKGRDV